MIKQCFVQGDIDNKNVYLTSGFQPPSNEDIFDRINTSAYMQGFASGGSVEHLFLGGKVDVEFKKTIIKKAFETPINYITVSPVISFCMKCKHKATGEYFVCPSCGDDEHMMIMARIVGFVRPIVFGKVKTENKMITGDENYWQESRRLDWVERQKI